jgi:hypothetical protein
MEVILALVIVVGIAAIVGAPLRRGAPAGAADDPRVADLEARKEAKYAEIRDARLDHAAGKLSDEDFRLQDAELRAEAVEILKQLDRLVPSPRGDDP